MLIPSPRMLQARLRTHPRAIRAVGLTATFAAISMLSTCGGGKTASPRSSAHRVGPTTSAASSALHSPSITQSEWVKLTNPVISHNDSVVLTGDMVDGQQAWYAVATRQSFDTRITPTVPGAQIDGLGAGSPTESARLTSTSGRAPDGTLVIAVAASTPVHDLTPAAASLHIQTYDPPAGKQVSDVIVRTNQNVDSFRLVAATSDTAIGYFDNNTSTVLVGIDTQTGTVRWQHRMSALLFDSETVAIGMTNNSGNTCGSLVVYSATTGTVIATVDPNTVKAANPAFTCWNDSNNTVDAISPGIIEVSAGTTVLVSLSTGRVIRNLNLDARRIDPQSSLIVTWPSSASDVSPLVVSSLPTLRTVWSLPNERVSALNLNVQTIFDKALYVTTSTQHLILDATNGHTIATSWYVYPVIGLRDWIVATRPSADQSSDTYFLVRHITSAAAAIGVQTAAP